MYTYIKGYMQDIFGIDSIFISMIVVITVVVIPLSIRLVSRDRRHRTQSRND